MKNLSKIGSLLLFVFIGYTSTLAQGDLMIFPKRLVFEKNQRSEDFTLINNGLDTAIYTITMVNYRMTENGNFEEITSPDPGQHFADKHIRIFPRTVTLAPNEAQKVKVQVYRASQLGDGEYRSHLFFQAVKEREPLGKKVIDENPKGITTILNINFGISIPVIIEVGNPSVRADLSNFSLGQDEQGSPLLSFTIHRKGERSIYGDLTVVHMAPSGAVTEVGSVKGVAVYTPIPQRHFTMVLLPEDGVDFSSGKLVIDYTSHDTKDIPLAKGELVLK